MIGFTQPRAFLAEGNKPSDGSRRSNSTQPFLPLALLTLPQLEIHGWGYVSSNSHSMYTEPLSSSPRVFPPKPTPNSTLFYIPQTVTAQSICS